MVFAPRALVKVCGTELLDSDSREIYRQKIARITLDSMVQFVGLLDDEGTVLEINQVALDAVGIALKDVEGKPFWTTFWWQVSDEINNELRESIRRAAQGEFVRWDTEIYGRAGGKETIIIDASLMPVKDENGKVVFIAAEGRDITEKKAYEREIARQREELAELVKPFSARESLAPVSAQLKLAQARKDADARVPENEARFRALLTVTSDVIYRMSPDWSEMTLLRGTEFLADPADVSNAWLEKYIHPDDRAEFMKAIRDAIQSKHVFEMEHRVFRADGTLGWTLSRAIPMLDHHGNVVEWLGAASDVTAKKQAQEGLRQSLAIVDSADDAIVSKNLDGIVQTWNKGAVRMFGYTSQEMVGQPVLRLIPEELHYEEDEILRKLRAGDRIDHYETIRRKKDGQRIEVSVTISPIRDSAGRVVGASKIARDISDRKRVERLLVQSEKLAATGRMAAAIAHEINNPLESLVNLIFLARKNCPPDGKAQAHLETAEQELERVAHIARQTLGYYRDTGLPAELHLHELIENVLTVYKAKLVGNDIRVEAQFNDIQKITVSRGELLQVFSNIITNAVDAMQGGGTLNITTRKISGSTGEGIQTVIRDSGVGIKQEHLEKIFEPFFTTKGNLGTGIGLWIARQLTERRGGQISVASSTEPGSSGTSVTIFVPFAAPAPQPPALNQ